MAADYSQGIAPYLAQFPRPAAEAEALCAALCSVLGKGQRIVDLGAGLGTSALALAEAGHELIAVEPDAEMAAVFGARLAAAAPELQARIGLLPSSEGLQPAQADLLLCQSVLHLLPEESEQLALLREAARLLHPGGQLWLELPVPSSERQAMPLALTGEKRLGSLSLRRFFEMQPLGEDAQYGDWQTELRFELHQGERLISRVSRLFRWRPMPPELLRRLGEAAGLRWLGLGGNWEQSDEAPAGPPGYGYARLQKPG